MFKVCVKNATQAFGLLPSFSFIFSCEKLAEEWIKTQSALHNPDMSAGGNPLDVTGVGDAGINSSIGSQWGNGNAELLETQIRDSIKSIDPKEYTTTYLNVKLTSE